jgi:Concanavalin A-like lectin/glucanases superfamily
MSAITPYQPTLPPEGAFTDAELDFMESEPPSIFPENQNSNFGLIIRKLFTDRVQELISQQDTLYNERFVETSTQFLDEWEIQESLPAAPSGLDVGTRQSIALSRIRKGPFTRTMRRNIVENYLQATFGTSVAFSPSGVALPAAGLQLFGDGASVAQLYEIVEDVPNFLYHIYIDNSTTPASGMARELNRVTPAGISYDINFVANAAPRLYWKLNEPAATLPVDLSPYAHPAVGTSGITLGTKALTIDPQPAALFSNAGSYIRSTYAPFVVNSSRTFMGWGFRNSSADQDTIFMDEANAGPMLYAASGINDVSFRTISSNPQTWVNAWQFLGNWIHWALTYNDSTKIAELFINGVSKGTKTLSAAYAGGATNFQLGFNASTSTWGGYQRDVVVYERILSAAEILSYAHGFTRP